MYVFNEVTSDARVLREAQSLHAQGHVVTIVGRTGNRGLDPEAADVVNGLRIVRIPISGTLRRLALGPPPLAARGRGRGAAAGSRHEPEIPRGRGAPGGPDGRSGLSTAPERHPGSRWPWPLDVIDWALRWRLSVASWARAAGAHGRGADVHHGHDLTGLTAAVRGAKEHRSNGLVVYDSHDLFADAGSTAARSAPVRRVVRWLERRWAGQADAVITVNEGLRAALTERL